MLPPKRPPDVPAVVVGAAVEDVAAGCDEFAPGPPKREDVAVEAGGCEVVAPPPKSEDVVVEAAGCAAELTAPPWPPSEKPVNALVGAVDVAVEPACEVPEVPCAERFENRLGVGAALEPCCCAG